MFRLLPTLIDVVDAKGFLASPGVPKERTLALNPDGNPPCLVIKRGQIAGRGDVLHFCD